MYTLMRISSILIFGEENFPPPQKKKKTVQLLD